MLVRIVAALVGLAIVLPIIVLGGELPFEGLVAFVLVVACEEYSRIAAPGRRGEGLAVLLLASAALYGTLVWGLPAQFLPVLAIAVLSGVAWSMLRIPDTGEGAAVAARLVLGLVWLPVLLSFLPAIRRFEDGVGWIILLLAVTWLGDTGAYFAGRAFGRTKLFERVSPKKTWEGVAGGALLSAAGGCVVKLLFLPSVGWGHAVALAVVCNAAGVTGDLAESMFKRAAGVKDTGGIMPGHGGILDRIDSLLFSAPVAWVYAQMAGLG